MACLGMFTMLPQGHLVRYSVKQTLLMCTHTTKDCHFLTHIKYSGLKGLKSQKSLVYGGILVTFAV